MSVTYPINEYPELRLVRNPNGMSVSVDNEDQLSIARRIKQAKLNEQGRIDNIERDMTCLKEDIQEVRCVLQRVLSLLEGSNGH